MDIQVFYDVYKMFNESSGVSIALTISKAICILLILVQYTRIYLEAYNVNGKVSMSYKELLRPIALISLLAGYTYLYDNLNKALVYAESEVTSNLRNLEQENKNAVIEGKIADALNDENDLVKPPATAGKMNMLNKLTQEISGIKNIIMYPSSVVIRVMTFLTEVVDALIYSFVLAIRFGMLFILRFFGPFAIAASIYDRFRGIFYKWVSAFVRLYIWIFAIFLINLFTSLVASTVYHFKAAALPEIDQRLVEGVVNTISDFHDNIAYSMTLFLMVGVKLFLYFQSKKILTNIFTS